MTLAKLSIDLEARLGRLEQDMGRATALMEREASKMERAFAGAGASVKNIFTGSLLSDALQQAVRTLADLVPQLVHGVAKFQDLAEETGASAAGLASFQTAADVSGVSVESLAVMMTRLTGKLSALKDEDKGAAQAIKNLGINFDEFSKLRPDEKMRALAEAFDKFADGEAKTSNALALFGKSGYAVLRFFKEYQESGASVVKLTDEQIQRADAFADAQARASSQLRQHAQVLVVEALPAVAAFKGALVDALKTLFDVDDASGKLSAGAAVREWAFDAAKGVAVLAEALVGIARLARALGGSFQAVGADISLAFAVPAAVLDPKGGSLAQRMLAIKGLLDERNKIVAEANQRYVDLWEYDGARVSKAIDKASQAARLGLTGARADAFADPRSTLFGSKAKPELDKIINFGAGGKGKKEKPDVFGPDLPDSVAEAIKRIEGADENKLQRLRDTLAQLAAIASAGVNVPDSVFSQLVEDIGKLDPKVREATEALREFKSLVDEGARITQENLTPLERYAQQIEKIARLLQQGVISDETAFRAGQRALDEMNGKLEKSKSLAEELGMTFASAFEDAVVGGKGLRDIIKGIDADITRLLLRKLVTEPAAEWITGAIKGMGGGGGASGMLGGIGSWFSSLFSGWFADGGYIAPGKWGMTGERGPEPVFGGRSGATVRPYSGAVTINISVPGNTDGRTAQQVAVAAARAVATAQRRGA